MAPAKSGLRFHTHGVASLWAVLIVGVIGCSSEDPLPAEKITQPAGYLPRLNLTKNETLASLLKSLKTNQGLPEQIRRRPIPRKDNAGPSLEALIPTAARKRIFDETQAFFPSESWDFSMTNWERAMRFLEKHDSTRISARQAINGKQCNLEIDHTQALTIDLSIIYAIHAIARMEAISARQSMNAGDLGASVEAVNAMLALARCLDEQTHISCRLQAVHVRTDALLVLEAICQHESTTREVLLAASQAVDMALQDWPEERDAWRSDRALSLICYEYARSGNISSVLTAEETEALNAEDQDALARFEGQAVDADAVRYLEAMQHVIDQCGQPLFRREGIALELPSGDSRDTVDPSTAGSANTTFSLAKLLAESIPQGQALFALDRARMEAWQVGLSHATGEPAPAFQVSPLSGQAYRVIERDETVAVWGVGRTSVSADRPIVIRKIL
ncbi:MAG: hypothetical protein MPJ50_00685 [Pirellulales bacterium]|nr:hypothetical protein [Pirellulales bacterium]